jgi:zinc transport system substrate-binding protein
MKMKKIILILTIGYFSLLSANVNAVVSILPQQTFLKAIGGDKVNISLMVKPGNSPHTYEPKPSQMKDISKADIYFSIGTEFEHVWLPKFANQNKKMEIVNISKGIEKIKMEKHSHEEEKHDEHDHHKDEKSHDKHDHEEHKHEAHHDHHEDEHHGKSDEHDEHDHEGLDPHIWTSPANVKIIAKNIYNELVEHDKVNKAYYKTNYEKFLNKIKQTDKKIKQTLIDVETNSKFMVFHPAWGYFARDYGLVQIAIESGGKSPKPKQLAHLIKEAKEEKVKAVFAAPEFSNKAAKVIAKELGIPVIKVSPLNPKWSQNLQKLANAIANK